VTAAPDRARAALSRGFERITGSTLAPYQAAVVRIGFGLCFAAYLLREWPNRRVLYGDSSPWGLDLARRMLDLNGSMTLLSWSGSTLWFELVYHAALLAAVALMLGWRTRTASVLFMLGVLSVQNRSVFVGDGGDNVIHLMSIYLVFTRCGQVWSLDARRARRRAAESGERGENGEHREHPEPSWDATGLVLFTSLGVLLAAAQLTGFAEFSPAWSVLLWALWLAQLVRALAARRAERTGRTEGRELCEALGRLAHNAAMLVIAAEVCLIYATAGWYKIQGDKWQDGSAVHYPLHLDYFTPWPALSELLAGSSLLVLVLTYGSVIVQVAFPFVVFNRRVKNVLLVLMIGEHLGIAVVLGLPFFSAAMITADAVFLPTAFLLWTEGRVRRLRLARRSRSSGGRVPMAADPAVTVLDPPRFIPPPRPETAPDRPLTLDT
jgi:hypothetical protein